MMLVMLPLLLKLDWTTSVVFSSCCLDDFMLANTGSKRTVNNRLHILSLGCWSQKTLYRSHGRAGLSVRNFMVLSSTCSTQICLHHQTK